MARFVKGMLYVVVDFEKSNFHNGSFRNGAVIKCIDSDCTGYSTITVGDFRHVGNGSEQGLDLNNINTIRPIGGVYFHKISAFYS